MFETLEFFNVKKHVLADGFLLIDIASSKAKYFRQLAYANYAFKVLFASKLKDVFAKTQRFTWNKHYHRDFCVRCIGMDHDLEKKFASLIWHRLKHPKVNLKTPISEFVFIKLNDVVYATLKVWENRKDFFERKAHLRPELHPSSLDPRLARACINIASGTGRKRILDPFCGSGGILIEAGLMGHRIRGYDIDEIMMRRATINLDFYGIKGYKIELRNAINLNTKADAVVTDIPYGRNTKAVDTEQLISKFLAKAATYTHKIILMLPSDVNYKHLLGSGKNRWDVKKEFVYYLHKSLSKRIVVLSL